MLIKPLFSSLKHFLLKVSCSDHSKSVMCHLLSTICCIQGFSGILSKTFSEHCSFNNEIYHKQLKRFPPYILVALLVSVEEVKLRGQHPNFERRQQFLTYSNVFCLFYCFTSQVNSYGHCGTVSSPNHTFSWASLNKQLTSTSCTYFRL